MRVDTVIPLTSPQQSKNVLFAFKHIIQSHWMTSLYIVISTFILGLLIYFSLFAATMDQDNSVPDFLTCRSWAYSDMGNCGLWGINCRPFESDWRPIRCPDRCTLDQSDTLKVIGSGPYRGDSRICRSAIHAGVISSHGGCAYMRYTGEAQSFKGSFQNGVESIDFPSWFPKTFEFRAGESSHCYSFSFIIVLVSTLLLSLASIVPYIQAQVLYYCLITWGFFYVRFIGQPIASYDYDEIAMNSFGEIFVLLAASYCLYIFAPAYTFKNWQFWSNKKKFIFWTAAYVLPFQILVNMNVFSYVPWLNIDLSATNDETSSVWTFVVYSFLICIIVGLGGWFVKELYHQGLLLKYFIIYLLLFINIAFTWLLFNSASFHFHHTMIGAVLLPFTPFQTPAAAVSQAALLGVIIQGYAAWGWYSYLEEKAEYRRVPIAETGPIASNITSNSVFVTWDPLKEVDGYSLIFNGVEVYRGYETSAMVVSLYPNTTYFTSIAGVAYYGTDGRAGVESNFTTKSEE